MTRYLTVEEILRLHSLEVGADAGCATATFSKQQTFTLERCD